MDRLGVLLGQRTGHKVGGILQRPVESARDGDQVVQEEVVAHAVLAHARPAALDLHLEVAPAPHLAVTAAVHVVDVLVQDRTRRVDRRVDDGGGAGVARQPGQHGRLAGAASRRAVALAQVRRVPVARIRDEEHRRACLGGQELEHLVQPLVLHVVFEELGHHVPVGACVGRGRPVHLAVDARVDRRRKLPEMVSAGRVGRHLQTQAHQTGEAPQTRQPVGLGGRLVALDVGNGRGEGRRDRPCTTRG
mmetsp:Transcript_51250/g.128716  ORF Transcript_51250/g.128716 Transcript_51250/m.128716 type:complete len:248 (-) Transcript_51250:1275-2018(-)